MGCVVGEGTFFFDPVHTQVDVTRPYLLKIGRYCKITGGVQILTHDHSRSVLLQRYGRILESARMTEIGDNVFIGVRSIVLPGVRIGNHVIVGAGSVVASDVPDDVVVAGNPARVIMTLEEYLLKREDRVLEEATEYARRMEVCLGRPLVMRDMGDFFSLYFKGSLVQLRQHGVRARCNGDDPLIYERALMENVPYFGSFQEFLDYANTVQVSR